MSVKALLLASLKGAAGDNPTVSIDASDIADIRITGLDAFEEARLFANAGFNMSESRSTLGQAILAALWHIYNNGLLLYLGRQDEDGQAHEYNPEDFPQWVRENFAEGEGEETVEYAATLSYVVDVIFSEVHQRANSDDPLMVDGHPVTVARLLERPKMVSRLISIRTAFENANSEERATLVEATLKAKSRDEVARTAKSIRDGAEVSWIELPYRQVMNEAGTFDVVLRGLTPEQLALFESLISKHARRDFEDAPDGQGVTQW